MPYFKDTQNNTHFLDDVSFSHLLPDGSVQITEAEADSIREANVQPPPQTQFTSLEFLDRFTGQEQIAVVTATLANAQVKLWYDKMLAASFVDLNDERVGFGLDALVGSGLLTEDRKQQIMTP